MANPQLSVEITAKIDALRDGFNQAIRETGKWDAATKKALADVDKGFTQLATDVERSSNTVSKSLAKSAMATASSGKAISAGANQAGVALTNLGRVAQDAPFGFVGIQNNLNPLLESFQRLRAESGSNAGALKALGQSLIGPAGIGIALSVVSAAILLYQDYQRTAKNTTDALASATADYNKELANNNAGAITEITNLQSLISVAKDETVSKTGRLQAIKKINEIMPDYLKDITLDGINSEETTRKIKKYTEAVYLNAKIKAASTLIEKEYTKQFEAQSIAVEDNASAFQKVGAGIGAFSAGLGAGLQSLNQLSGANSGLVGAAKATDVYNASIKRLGQNNLDETIDKSNKSIDVFKNILNESNKELANMDALFSDKKGGGGGAEKKFKSLSEIMAQLRLEIKLNDGQLDKTFNEKRIADLDSYQKAIDELTKNGFNPQGKEIKSLVSDYDKLATAIKGNDLAAPKIDAPKLGNLKGFDVKFKAPEIEETLTALKTLRDEYGYTDNQLFDFVSNYGLSLDELLNKTISFNTSLSEILNTGIKAGLSDLGQSIGSALASGANVAEAAGQSLLSTLGGILIQLGELAISTGIGIKAIKTALKSLNPVVAVAAGVALVALGTFVKGKASGIGGGSDSGSGKVPQVRGFATGGYNLAGGMAILGEKGPELVELPTGASVHNNTKTNRIIAGSNNNEIVVGSKMGISMGILYSEIVKENKKAKKMGLASL